MTDNGRVRLASAGSDSSWNADRSHDALERDSESEGA